MIARDLPNGTSVMIRQTDHAELSGQFAAHWGNERFARPDPALPMILAATHHDDHYRDIEAIPPIDSKMGRPYGHRGMPHEMAHFDALRQTVAWLKRRDPFAALMVSMHHSGLPQNRYGVIRAWQSGSNGGGSKRAITPELSSLIKDLEAGQSELIKECRLDESRVKFCYAQLQTFDLLSLYFCCDGFADETLREAYIDPVPTKFGEMEGTPITITPIDEGSVRVSPFPFDLNPLKITLMGRIMRRLPGSAAEECWEEFERAPRSTLSWTLTA